MANNHKLYITQLLSYHYFYSEVNKIIKAKYMLLLYRFSLFLIIVSKYIVKLGKMFINIWPLCINDFTCKWPLKKKLFSKIY